MVSESYTEGFPWLEEELKENKKEPARISPLFVAISGLLAYIISLVFTQFLVNSSVPYGFHIAMIIAEATLGIVPLYLVSIKYKEINMLKYMKIKWSVKVVLLGIIMGFALFFVGNFLTYILYTLLGPSQVVEKVNENIVSLAKQSVTSIILLGIGLGSAGIWEEILFRGLLLRSLEEKYNFRVAQIISSFFFGLSHPDPSGIYIIVTFIYGLILAEIYRKYESLYITIFTHATLNLTGLALIFLLYGG
ncbi:MAG: CPBP family intramembrane glutamic endopeptidase [Candidatus Asgardarchaeia archaeon]